MKIKNFKKNRDVLVVEYDEIKNQLIGDVSKYFTNNKYDMILITKNNKPFYILTSTDIIDSLVAHYDNMSVFKYIDKYPKSLLTVNKENSVFEAYRLMRSYKIHHLIAVDENGYYYSVINFHDFASYLTEIALKDEMTGLYNKRFFDFILDRYRKEEIEIGIIFLDLDNFKQINDSYGHLLGDKILKSVADIIKDSIRDIDYAFRFGGDEFVILIFSNKKILEKVAKRIKNKISQTPTENIRTECSIGYAHFPTDSNNLEDVLDIADKMMYEDKRK